MDLWNQGKIFPPSLLRLLRLAAGKHCERQGCSNQVKLVRKDYGLFFCSNCTSGGPGYEHKVCALHNPCLRYVFFCLTP
jgi:hypothetical protein